MVWTPPKNISQLGWLFPIYGKIKMFQTTNQIVCYQSVSNHCIDMIDMIYCLNQRLQGIHHLGVLGQCANEHSSLLAEPVDANWMPYQLASFWRTPLHHMVAAANGWVWKLLCPLRSNSTRTSDSKKIVANRLSQANLLRSFVELCANPRECQHSPQRSRANGSKRFQTFP